MNDSLDALRTRVKRLGNNQSGYNPQSIVYVMSRDCRVKHNFALLAAQQQAIKQKLPLLVVFVAYDKQLGNRAREHISFLLESLKNVKEQLISKNVPFILKSGDQTKVWPSLIDEYQPAAIYFDFSPLRHSLQHKEQFAKKATCPVFMVDAHNCVPVWVASNKQEVGARTLRGKIHHHLPTYLVDSPSFKKHPHTFNGNQNSEPLAATIKSIVSNYPSNGTDVSRFEPGEKAGLKAIDMFIQQRLKGYADERNDPAKNHLSELSPYLHYGNIISLDVASAVYNAVRQDATLQADGDTLIEEMIVRKELADNFCYYNPNYDTLKGAPDWAQKTLEKHAKDKREFTYTKDQFEKAQTHDEAWNAAQVQLIKTGKIHGYMRMYWAKKVLEWSDSPKQALEILLYLNDFYHIDGGDPNGYVGIMWSVAGVHDRPWGERPVYGQIRSMVYNGLKRKFDIEAYIKANA